MDGLAVTRPDEIKLEPARREVAAARMRASIHATALGVRRWREPRRPACLTCLAKHETALGRVERRVAMRVVSRQRAARRASFGAARRFARGGSIGAGGEPHARPRFVRRRVQLARSKACSRHLPRAKHPLAELLKAMVLLNADAIRKSLGVATGPSLPVRAARNQIILFVARELQHQSHHHPHEQQQRQPPSQQQHAATAAAAARFPLDRAVQVAPQQQQHCQHTH